MEFASNMRKGLPSQTGLKPVVIKPRLAGLLGAFTSRRKAIKYKVSCFAHRLKIDSDQDPVLQLLRIKARLLETRPTRIHLDMWEDGEMWIQVCQPGIVSQGGWAFLESFYGSYEQLEPRRIVELFERTISVSRASFRDEDHGSNLRKIWQPVSPRG